MSTRKFKADFLFTGEELLSSENVLITDDDGIVQGISNITDAGDDIETYQGIITPGFINTHCHLELSHMKGRISPKTGLIEFLTRVIKERNFGAEDIQRAMQLAEAEMFESGIVAVGDICNTTNSIAIKQNSKLSWFNFIEVIGFNESDAEARIDYAKKIAGEFNTAFQDDNQRQQTFTNTSVSPHAPYSVSKKLFGLINEESADKLITIHNQESEAENELYINRSGQMFELYQNLNLDAKSFHPSGKTSLQTYLPFLNKVSCILLVHNVFVGEDDLFVTGHTNLLNGAYFCICINANQYIQSVNPPIELLRSKHCNITLGTDSYASNHQLNILDEIKTIHRELPGIPLSEMLQWATINGAKALGMDSKLGTFDIGKRPGVVLINNIIDNQISDDSASKRLI